MPWMSAAGLERVNVTHRKLFSVRAVNSLSSTSTISGKAIDRIARRRNALAQNRAGSSAVSTVHRAVTASTPGNATRGSRKPSGKRRSRGQLRRQLAARRPDGGDHQLRAFVEPAARVVERVDRRAGLEVQIGSPIDALQQMAKKRRRCRGCPAPDRLPGDDQQILGQRQLPLAEDGVGRGQQLLRPAAWRHRARSARCRSPAAADARRPHRRRGPHGRRGRRSE